nr:unnamed protein product [Digitaria exilis]
MKNSSLLSLLVLVAAWPLTAAEWSRVSCGAGGSYYTANSTYQANLRRLAAVVPAEAAAAAASHRPRYGGYKQRAFGYWPNRLQAAWSCDARDETSDGACAACVAEAFKSVERECPFHREAFFFNGSCSLRLSEYRILGSDAFGRY